jgi:hypothetical protein
VSGAKPERRNNRELHEVLDELVEHVRHVTRSTKAMSREELAYAEQRLEWLAEDVWRAALEQADRDP